MHERMLNKGVKPTTSEIIDYIGKSNNELLEAFESELNSRYDIIKELRFPYGNSYGWSFKYSHKKKHICDLFFEKGSIAITIPMPSKLAEKVNEKVDTLLPQTRKMWNEKYPCGDGGWVNYRVSSKEELADILFLIALKIKPARKNGGVI
jgi:hypothetical protein